MVTGVDDEHRGDWISNQLDRFLQAVRSFQGLTRCQHFLPATDEGYTFAHWTKEWGFPKLLECRLPLIVPGIGRAREMMSHAREEIGPTPDEIHVSQVWRRWKPGAERSQMPNHHREVPLMWWRHMPRCRFWGKQAVPAWQSQRTDVEHFLGRMHRKGWRLIEVGGVTMEDWLLAQGTISEADILATVSVDRATAKASRYVEYSQCCCCCCCRAAHST